MQQLTVELKDEQRKSFEFKLYQFQGMQIAINQFLTNNSFDYNEEHYDRLTDTFAEKYQIFNEYIIQILIENGIKNVPVQILNYRYSDGNLNVSF